jgi:hypothetical protein
MNMQVQRFIARIKPRKEHPSYFEWQTGLACVFVGGTDRAKTQDVADREIHGRGWERIEFVERATLIEENVRREGGAVLEAYLKARAGEPFCIEELDDVAFAKKGSARPILAPRLTENFLDRVVLAAGGVRLDTDDSDANRPKTADYRVGDLILELKDLQSEGLDVRTRQEKLAELFEPKLRPDHSIVIDPSVLSESEKSTYVEIVGKPIKKRLQEAGRQVRATLERLRTTDLQGGVILLNTGYSSISSDVLFHIVTEYLAQSSTLSVAVCISAYTITNGFDSVFTFGFEPAGDAHRDIVRLRSAFWREADAMMTDWGRNGFLPPTNSADPLRPILFEYAGGIFTVPVPKPPNSVEKTLDE